MCVSKFYRPSDPNMSSVLTLDRTQHFRERLYTEMMNMLFSELFNHFSVIIHAKLLQQSIGWKINIKKNIRILLGGLFNFCTVFSLTVVLLQEMVYETLHALCQRLPEQQASACGLQVKAYLPKVLQQTPGNQVSLASGQATLAIVIFTSDETRDTRLYFLEAKGDVCSFWTLWRQKEGTCGTSPTFDQ